MNKPPITVHQLDNGRVDPAGLSHPDLVAFAVRVRDERDALRTELKEAKAESLKLSQANISLSSEIVTLTEALRPFVDASSWLTDDDDEYAPDEEIAPSIRVKHWRTARAALEDR